MIKRRVHKLQPAKSTFMREYYNGHYEDPAYIIINRNKRCKEIVQRKMRLEEAFATKLKAISKDLYESYDNIISDYLLSETLMLEEAYVLGAQDRDRVFQLQK